MNYGTLQQNTPEWHAFRSTGIGSSDTPIILGASPWTTPYQLWERRIGIKPPPPENPAMTRGKMLEPTVREMYETTTGVRCPPVVVRNASWPFLIASLDGWNDAGKVVVEIKCPLNGHAFVDGEIPEHYFLQMQHQLLVSGGVRADFVSFNGQEIEVRQVHPCTKTQMKIITAAKVFWKHIQEKTPPEITPRDYVQVDRPELRDAIDCLRALRVTMKNLQDQEQELKDRIIHAMVHDREINYGMRVAKVYRRGNVDYSKIPELKKINLEPYRKAGTCYYRFDEVEKT